MRKNYKWVKIVNRIIFIMIGSFLAAVALETFLIPNRVIDGGITGISIILNHVTKVPLGALILVLNLPFLFIGYKQIGKTFTLSTLFSIICLSIGVSLFKPITSVTDDVLLAAVFGGILLGIGVGLIIRNGGCLDGTEIVAIIFDKKTGFSIGEIVMFMNLFILSSAGLVFGWDRAMYSLIAYFIAFKVIDITVEGLNETKSVVIVSERHEDITAALLDRLGRGVTLLEGKGAYMNQSTNVIYVIVTRLEISKLKSIVSGFDENALVSIGSVDVVGKKYKKKAIH